MMHTKKEKEKKHIQNKLQKGQNAKSGLIGRNFKIIGKTSSRFEIN